MSAASPSPGFADPARDAAIAFRAILDAMSRPGQIVTINALQEAPSPLSVAAAATLLTLVDGDAGVWVAPDCKTPEADAFLRFHCGAVPVEASKDAVFAVGPWSAMSDFSLFSEGTDEYPDRAATLIVEVEALSTDLGLTLSGPGIETSTNLHVSGANGLGDAMRANRQRFPRGVDLILTCGDQIAALPRSIRVEV